MIALFLSVIFTAVDSLVLLPKYWIIIKFKLHNSGCSLPASAAYTPIDWVCLCSVAELNQTQSNGLSTIRLDLFNWVRLAKKLYSHRFRCSISFNFWTFKNCPDLLLHINGDNNVTLTRKIWKNLSVELKDQRRRSVWVGEADFSKMA